jgi:hypothetical protein
MRSRTVKLHRGAAVPASDLIYFVFSPHAPSQTIYAGDREIGRRRVLLLSTTVYDFSIAAGKVRE